MSELVCPITLNNIDVGEVVAITAAGQAYSVSAIERWLQSNDTDPLSGLRLSNKDVVKYVYTGSMTALEAEKTRVRDGSQLRQNDWHMVPSDTYFFIERFMKAIPPSMRINVDHVFIVPE